MKLGKFHENPWIIKLLRLAHGCGTVHELFYCLETDPGHLFSNTHRIRWQNMGLASCRSSLADL